MDTPPPIFSSNLEELRGPSFSTLGGQPPPLPPCRRHCCYAHQLNLILQQAVSQITSVRVLFANLNAFSVFFSPSPRRVSCLDDCVARRIPRSVQTRWNFHSRIVFTVFEHKGDLRKCFELIINTWKLVFVRDKVSVCKASGLCHWLQDRKF